MGVVCWVQFMYRFVARQSRRFCTSLYRQGLEPTDTNTNFDAIVVGGGHNGLVCSAYLAKAGKKVLVLERRHIIGGAAVTEELYEGFKYSRASYLLSLFRPVI